MVETRPFNVQNHLKTPEQRAAYIKAILDEGDPSLIASGLGEIARSIGAGEFARQAGLSREAVDKSLTAQGNPTLDTIAKALRALGLRLSVVPVSGGTG